MQKRLRIYAGPNGSGKSVLHSKLSSEVNNGFFVNADVIYKNVINCNFYDFHEAKIIVDDNHWQDFAMNHGLYQQASAIETSKVITNILKSSKRFNSYDVAIITDFIRNKLIEKGDSFSCETVFSHPSKLGLIEKAKRFGYRTYLYFCCAGDPLVCVERVSQRVKEGGHDVPADKIRQRYTRTLENLLPAMKLVDRTYIFDNSGRDFELIIEADTDQLKILSDYLPNWIEEFILDKLDLTHV
ncbi:MAG: zeta toxin family protein [Lentisphaeria bacterium]|nr:zeta toxin family protein [Lentisphaeria bacterium]